MTPSFFEPASAHIAMARWYDEQLDQFPLRCEILRLETSFGDTQVLKTGNPDGPPLLVLHEAMGCAPLSLIRHLNLAKDYCLYAPDIIGEPGMSAAYRPSTQCEEYGQWLAETISWLKLNDLSLLGHGLGGYIGLRTIGLLPTRFRRAVLISPLGIISPSKWSLLRQQGLPRQMFCWFQQEACLDKNILAWYTNAADCPRALFANILLYFKAPARTIRRFTNQELRSISCPITMVGNAKDVQAPGQALLGRAARTFPKLDNSLLLAHSRHIPDIEGYQQIFELL